MSERELLIKALEKFHSVQWINESFDLLRELLSRLAIVQEESRLTMFLFDEAVIVCFGRQIVFQIESDRQASCYVPYSYPEKGRNWFTMWAHESSGTRMITLRYRRGQTFPKALIDVAVPIYSYILRRSRTAKVKERHLNLLVDFTMDHAVRNELISELKTVAL